MILPDRLKKALPILSLVFLFSGLITTVYYVQRATSSGGKAAYLQPKVPAPTPLPTIAISLDNLLGQPNEHETVVNRVVGNRAFHITSVHIDSQDRIYILDSGNNRILGYRTFPRLSDQNAKNADIVIGQLRLVEMASVNRSNTLYLPPTAATVGFQPYPWLITPEESPRIMQMAHDGQDNLYIVDMENNRILKYIDPFNTDRIADDVWGQPDFNSRQGYCGQNGFFPTAATLCTEARFPQLGPDFAQRDDWLPAVGVDIDESNNIWVTDSGNNRVLRFPAGSKTADLVLGQANFSDYQPSAGWDLPLDRFVKPMTVRVKPATGEVYVLDGHTGGKARIMVFTPPFSNGMLASRVIGQAIHQPDPPDNPDDTWQEIDGQWVHLTTGFHYTYGFAFDTSGAGDIWVNDGTNRRVLLFDVQGNMIDVIGQPGFETRKCDGIDGLGYIQVDGSWANLCENHGEIGIDSNNNLYISQTYYPRDVARFSLPLQRNGQGLPISNGRILHNESGSRWNQISGKSFKSPYGLAISPNTNPPQLFVGDSKRILIWNNYANFQTYQRANYALGQDDFESNQNNTGLFGYRTIGSLTAGGGYLWVNTETQIYAFRLPITRSGSDYPTVKVLSSNNNVFWADDNQAVEFDSYAGVIYDHSQDALWVSDRVRNRVFRIHNPLGRATVDLVLGQPNKESVTDNAGEKTINAHGFGNPWSLNFDNYRNLYVVDSVYEGGWEGANNRVLRFSTAGFDLSGSNNSNIFPLPDATGVYTKTGFNVPPGDSWGEHTPSIPTWVTFDSINRMLLLADSDRNSQQERAFIYEPDHVNQTTPQPQSVLPIKFGQSAQAVFNGDDDHLISQDHNWNRILFITIARQPAPTLACIRRPACLDAEPPCRLRIPEPAGGWCGANSQIRP